MYQRILVPIDGSATSERGLAEAIAIARMSGGSIRLLHVLDDLVFTTGFETGATYTNTVLPQLRQHSEQILAAGRERVAAAGVSVDTLCVECFARRPRMSSSSRRPPGRPTSSSSARMGVVASRA